VNAALAVRLFLKSPALPQKLQAAREVFGSRQWYQKRRWMFHRVRWARTSLNARFRNCACPAGPLLMPKLSGGAEPQAISVIQSGVVPSAWLFITLRTFWTSVSIVLIVDAYGCSATASK